MSDFKINITLEYQPDDGKVTYIAACPPDHRSSFSGSALPFANPKQAFEGTPNKGIVEVDDKTVTLQLRYPNAYYVGLGTVYIPPMVYISYMHDGKRVEESVIVSQGVPFRTLTYPAGPTARARIDATFYEVEDKPVRSQEEILRASAFPEQNITPENFWGMKPPL